MVVAISRFRVSPDAAPELARRFAERSRRVDQHDGFLGLEVLVGGVSEREFVLLTRWRDRAALKAYMTSDDFRAVHQQGEEEGADFKLYELVTT